MFKVVIIINKIARYRITSLADCIYKSEIIKVKKIQYQLENAEKGAQKDIIME